MSRLDWVFITKPYVDPEDGLSDEVVLLDTEDHIHTGVWDDNEHCWKSVKGEVLTEKFVAWASSGCLPENQPPMCWCS